MHSVSIPNATNTANSLTATEPPLTPAERAIIKEYGGWTQFMLTFGLKPHDEDDIAEAKQIVERIAAVDSESE